MARPALDVDAVPDGAFEKMGTTREEMRDRIREMAEYDEGTPAAGTLAPDFEIERLDAAGQRSGKRFSLSGHMAGDGGRPVALVFGSYT